MWLAPSAPKSPGCCAPAKLSSAMLACERRAFTGAVLEHGEPQTQKPDSLPSRLSQKNCAGRLFFFFPRLSVLHPCAIALLPRSFESHPGSFPFADFRLTPHYPAKSPLDDVLRHVIPGADEYVTEKYAFEIMRVLGEWSQGLKEASPALAILAKFLDTSIEATSLVESAERSCVREMGSRSCEGNLPLRSSPGSKRFLEEIKTLPVPAVASGDGGIRNCRDRGNRRRQS